MRELGENEDLNTLVQNDFLCIFEFGDEETCPPCTAIKKKIDMWSEGKMDICARFVPVKKHTELCAQNEVFSIPCVLIYINGKQAMKQAAYFSLDQMLDYCERMMKMKEGEEI